MLPGRRGEAAGGSAVAHAIRDTGWTVRDLDILHERLTFARLQ
ncbi:hypothetical protein [Parafrankia discariae]|nr:hypothetical protein [Parafrankia discariae]